MLTLSINLFTQLSNFDLLSNQCFHKTLLLIPTREDERLNFFDSTSENESGTYLSCNSKCNKRKFFLRMQHQNYFKVQHPWDDN